MDDLIAVINAALRARGWSAQHASMEAVASPDYVRDLRRGRVRQVEKFRRLCKALDLEFYVGPRRRFASIDERRLEVAVDTAVQAVRETGVELEPVELAHAIAAVYELVGEEEAPAHADRLRRLVRTLTKGRPRGDDASGDAGT